MNKNNISYNTLILLKSWVKKDKKFFNKIKKDKKAIEIVNSLAEFMANFEYYSKLNNKFHC